MGFFSGPKSSSLSQTGLKAWGDAGNQMVERLGGDYGFMQDSAKDLYNNPGSLQMDRMGFFTGANGMSPVANAFQQAAAQGWSGASGNAARRGQMQSENLANVSGQAAMNIMPQFVPLINQNMQTAQMYGKDNQFKALSLMGGNLGVAGGMLGGESRASQTAGGIGYNFANELGKNLAQWANPQTFGFGGGKSSGGGTGNMFAGGGGGGGMPSIPGGV